jgi:hypothetical protein
MKLSPVLELQKGQEMKKKKKEHCLKAKWEDWLKSSQSAQHRLYGQALDCFQNLVA